MSHMHKDGQPSRVNLSVDVQTQGGTKKIVLPHKILVIGDFSAGKSTECIQARKRYAVTRESRDAVMLAMAPELKLQLDNKIKPQDGKISMNLVFESLHDFHPDALVKRVPALRQLLAMRHLLKELRAQVVENHEFKNILNSLVQHEAHRHALTHEISSTLRLGRDAL